MMDKAQEISKQVVKNEQSGATAVAPATTASLVAREGTGLFSTVMKEVGEYFDSMVRNMESLIFPDALSGWPWARFAPELPDIAPARVDLVDNGKAFELTAEVPGFARDQVTVEVSPEGLELLARREDEKSEKDEKKGYRAHERSYRALHRVIAFPEEVDPTKANAELKDGVLTVQLPKAHPAEDRKTKIKIN